METPPKPVKLLIIIVEKAKGKKVVRMLNSFKLTSQIATVGIGTASTSLQSILGLCETCRAVLFAVVPEQRTAEILASLEEEFAFTKPGTGVAFTIPIKSVASMHMLQYMLGAKEI